jgi:pilus assembly protein CpaE
LDPGETPALVHPVAVVDDDPKVRTRLAMQLGEGVTVSSFPSIETMEDKFVAGTALVVLFGPSYADPAALKAVQGLTRFRPEIGALLVVNELNTSLLQQALRAGVRDVIELPADGVQLRDAIERVAETIRVLPAGTDDEGRADATVDGGAVITVFSSKGGAGKSVVASNLAVALARKAGGQVALVDADLKFGDVAVMLKLVPRHTILDAVSAIHRIDAQLLQSLLIRHEPSGLLVLPAPVEPAFADQVNPAEMLAIVKLLQSFCEYVVIDTPSDYTGDVTLGLLEHSDDVLLVAGMEIPNIKNVRVGLSYLRLLNFPSSKLRLVVNRANSRVKLDVNEVERTLQIKADCLVPSDIAVPTSVNKGSPVVLDAPRSGVAKNIEALADQFLARRQYPRRRP